MNKTPIHADIEQFPAAFHALLADASIYDNSSSKAAQVFFIDKDRGYFLKSAPKGALETEAELTRFFHKKQLSAEVLAYLSHEKDWLLTAQLPGEDCTHSSYLQAPKRLCDTLAELLRTLHETDYTGCPVTNRTESYLAAAAHNYRAGLYDSSLFPDNWGYASAEEAWSIAQNGAHLLKADTLLHGDYCLPNIILNHWRFSGFIDVGCSGVGDKHIDLFWGIWSLAFNLKTNQYQDRFLDAYGRRDINTELLKVIAAIEVFG